MFVAKIRVLVIGLLAAGYLALGVVLAERPGTAQVIGGRWTAQAFVRAPPAASARRML